jgi:cytochrome c peroxidase
MRTLPNIVPQTLTPGQQHGRILFNSASDPRLSAQATGGVACASCHPDGREDGHTWDFPEGSRNTPSLVGRFIGSTAPYHYDGQVAGPIDFGMVVTVRMGGTGIGASDFEDIFAFLESEPAPDNPNRAPDGSLTPDQAAGAMLFNVAGCGSCHGGPALTDNGFHNVSSGFTTVPMSILQTGIIPQSAVAPSVPNTPSLLGAFAAPPYLHDGSMDTLHDVVASGHGRGTAILSDAQVDQLVAYLQRL